MIDKEIVFGTDIMCATCKFWEGDRNIAILPNDKRCVECVDNSKQVCSKHSPTIITLYVEKCDHYIQWSEIITPKK